MTYPVPAVGTRLTADFLASMLEVSARKGSATSRTSTTVQAADPDLVVAVDANAVYELVGAIHYTALTGASSGGITFGWTLPAGASGDIVYSGKDTTTSVGNNNDQTLSAAMSGTASFGALASGNTGFSISGTFITSGTAGSLTFTWAQRTSSVTATTVQANSYIKIKRIG